MRARGTAKKPTLEGMFRAGMLYGLVEGRINADLGQFGTDNEILRRAVKKGVLDRLSREHPELAAEYEEIARIREKDPHG